MPIKIPDNLPARKTLSIESVDLIDSSAAEKQDIRPLKFLLLNLMPKKIITEIQFARLIGASPVQIELTLMTTKSYNPRNTKKDYLIEFYKTLDDVKETFFDVLIITGAPVETLPFEKVEYWKELLEIVDWSKTNVFRRIGICWGAQALLKILFNVDKHKLPSKMFGVYDHSLIDINNRLLHGFIDHFPMPVSRFTENRKEEILKNNLDLIAFSEISGVGMVRCPKTKDLFILNHLEYDASTLNDEYLRDLKENTNIQLPENYYPKNDSKRKPVNRWRPYAFLLFSNFINDVYQNTPFNLKEYFKKKKSN